MSGPASPSLVEVERRGHVSVLWMRDSARRNALSVALVTELLQEFERSRAEGARGVVIASREKAFCAGADLRDMLDNGWLDAAPGETGVTPPKLFAAIETDPRPVAAAVDGLTLGGGVELCLACDLVVSGPSAAFALPELGLGVLPNTALARLPHLIGARAAATLILTRRRVDAAQAHRLGLTSVLTEEGCAVDEAVGAVQDIAEKVPPTAFAAAKRRLRSGPGWGEVDSYLAEMDPQEWREGASAFFARRPPDYSQFWPGDGGPPREDAPPRADAKRPPRGAGGTAQP